MTMHHLKLLFLFCLLCVSLPFAVAQSGDGIPDNCESNPDYVNQFVRYEPHNRRLVLVDWTTGDEIRTIANDLDNTIILGWSISCQYLAIATGESDSTDTVVWNVVTGERMGSVDDARHQTHYITWGPGDYLVVETRNGAILWHVPTYQQMTLTTHFDPVTVRNFSRLRWDNANGQLIANLSGGGRLVYDLSSGQEVPVVAERTDTYPDEADSEVTIGSAPYDCNGGYRYGYRYWYQSSFNAPQQVFLDYSINTQQVAVALYNSRLPDEVLVVLENDMLPSFFDDRGWSADCRYVVASIGHVGSDSSDTYVWDVTTGQRVGIIEDAREIVHPIIWHPNQPVLLVETRNGAILWHLPSNTQTLLDSGAETALAGRSDVRNFSTYTWSNNALFFVPINDVNTVQVNHISTGESITSLTLDNSIERIEPSTSGAYALICCDTSENHLVWNLQSGRVSPVAIETEVDFYFNPSDRYMVNEGADGIYIWHLDSLNPDGSANRYYPDIYIGWDETFSSDIVLSGYYGDFNLETGEFTPVSSSIQSPVATTSVSGETGYGSSYHNCSGRYFNGRVSQNPRLYEYSIYDGDSYLFSVQARFLSWSPDCRWLYGEVPYLARDPHYDNAPVDDSYREQASDYLVFWDAATGELVQSFYHPYRFQTYSRVSWSPDSSYAIVKTTEGAFLYNLNTNSTSLLLFNRDNDSLSTYFNTYWDFERGFVLVSGQTAIYAFDIGTGNLLYEFIASPTQRTGCSYYRSCAIRVRDNQYLIVGDSGSIGVWNLDTLVSYFISTRPPGTYNSERFTRFHMSPSERYLISVRRDGRIAVWDLQDQPENVRERLPYYVSLRNIGQGFQSIRFVDDLTVEISQLDGTSYQLSILPPNDE